MFSNANLLPTYAELDCLSNFTFLRGASHPEELVREAARLGYQALALADECSMAGMVRAHTEAARTGLHLIVGSRFVVHQNQQAALELIALAANEDGYGNLCQLITAAHGRANKHDKYRLELSDLQQGPPGLPGLRHLPGCLLVAKPLPDLLHDDHAHPFIQALRSLQQVMQSRLWLGLTRPLQSHDQPLQHTLTTISRNMGIPLVALGQVEQHIRARHRLHHLLTAIRLKKTVDRCGHALAPNAERHLRPRFQLARLFPSEALQETLNISRQCQFSLQQIRYQYPQDIVPPTITPTQYLQAETWAGAQRRYPHGVPDTIQAQIQSELDIIAKLHYEPYFLTVYDIVRHARSREILCQGRGSAANSVVCYCLGITEVNPMQIKTLFARFISAERNEPPDIDVDFEHQRREEVIQYIYERYGRTRAALTAVIITYRRRSALRDTGKALGFDAHTIDRVCRSCQYWDSTRGLLDKLDECGLDTQTLTVRHWAVLAQTLIGFPRHLSQHPGGFVIANDTLSRLVPIEQAAMPGRSIVQWDKDDLDAMGMLKIDILALGMLSMLKRALDLISARRQTPFTLQDIPSEDPATYAMIQQADTMGVFQIESRAQMSMLPRLKPDTFYDLVIQIAIVRPGPIQGEMVHPYLRRRRREEPVSYPTSEVRDVLSRTLGVPIFQEQVMQVAMVAANFSADEADQLRRSMAAWRRKGGIDRFRPRLVAGMRQRGYPIEFITLILKQLEGFGEYGFPESHSASFANLAYASAWIKCHEPAVFLAALLNSQPMGFYGASQLVQDARRHGVTVLPVCVNASAPESSLEGKAVRLGLNQVKSLSGEASTRLYRARQSGAFASMADLTHRIMLDRRDLDALAHAGALHSLAPHRHAARWEAAWRTPNGLLNAALTPDPLPDALSTPTEAQDIVNDYQATGLTLGRHPLALLRERALLTRFTPARQLYDSFPDRRLAKACGLVTVRQRPQTAKGVIFVTLEDDTGHINVIVRPELAERQRHELLESQLLGVYGVWQRHESVCHLIASRLVNLNDLINDLPTRSRDFQ